MQLGGALPRTVVAEIILVYAVNDVAITTFRRVGFQPDEEFVFAVKATIFVVLDVIWIFKLESVDVFVVKTAFARELFGIAFM